MSTERMDALVRTLETRKETVAEALDTAIEVVFDEKVGTKIPIFSWARPSGMRSGRPTASRTSQTPSLLLRSPLCALEGHAADGGQARG